MYRHLIIVLALMLAACAPNTKNVRFDPDEAQTIPREVAVDAVTAFSKSTVDDKDCTCVFTDKGVMHKDSTAVVPYEQLSFSANNKAYGFASRHPHIYIFKKQDGTSLCDSLLTLWQSGQRDFENRFKWIGSALLALGTEYK